MTTIAEFLSKSRELVRNVPAYLSILRIVSAGSRSLFAACLLVNVLLAQLPAILAYTSQNIIDSLGFQSRASQTIGPLKAPLFFGFLT
jgi:hypothetical protein